MGIWSYRFPVWNGGRPTHEDFDRYFGQLGIQPLRDTQWNVIQSTSPNVPDYVVVPRELSLILDLCLENSDIKICDFGGPLHGRGQPNALNPICCCARGSFGGSPLNGCMGAGGLMSMFLANHQLFPGEVRNHPLQSMALSLGKFPDSLWTRWDERTEYLGENANPLWYPSSDLRPKVPARKLMSIINELWG
jgi:hypothetical protein